jgi:hypothetical protein
MGTLRRTLSLLSVVAMLSTLVVSTAFAGTLPPDVTEGDDTSWYTGSLANLVAMGCVDGDADFNPGAYATRAETAQMLACALTGNAIPAISEAPAGDVASDDAAAAAISYLMGAGVVSGYTDADGVSTGMFGPADLLTREQVAKMTALGYGLVDGGVSFPFSDSVSDWAGDYVTNSYTWGVVTGYPDGTFGGGNNVLKAEVVAMVERAMDPVHVETGETPAEYSADGGSTDGGETPAEPAGGLTVSAMSMGSQEVPTGATGVVVAAFEFSANDGDAEVSSVTVERSGLGNETDFDKVYLYDEDMVKIGSGKSLSSSDEEAEFTNVGIDVEDGESTTVYVVVDIDTGITETGTHAFSVVDVDAGDSDVTLDGATGDSFETSLITIGAADVESDSDSHTAKVGEDSVEVADFNVHVDSTEDGTFTAVALYLDGDSEIISNPVLERGATEVGSCEVSGEYVVCSGIDYEIENGESASFTLYADLDGEAGDSVDIYIEDKTDVAIMGDSFGYNLTLDETEGDDGNSMIEELDTTPGTDTVTLEAGQLTLAYNGPAAGDISENTNNVTLIDFSLSAESDVEIEDATFAVFGSNLETGDVEDLELVCNGTVIGQISGLTDEGADGLDDVSDVQTFEDTWTIDGGETVDCELRLDIQNALTGDEVVSATIIALSGWSIEDDNGDDVTDILPSGNIAGNDMTILAASLEVNVAGSPASGQDYVKGTDDAEMVAFVFTAGEGQDVTISALSFDAAADGGTCDDGGTSLDRPTCEAGDGAADAGLDGDTTLDGDGIWTTDLAADDYPGGVVGDGDTAADVLSVISISSGGMLVDSDSLDSNDQVTFDSLDWTIEAGTSETLLVSADIATTSSASADVAIALNSVTAEYGTGTALTATLTGDNNANGGLAVSQKLDETGTLTQSLAAASPENSLVADGSNDVVFTTVRLDAENEAFTIDKYGVIASNASGLTQAGIMCADADGVVNTYSQVFVGDNAEFTGLDCYVEKDETAYMYLMADITTVESGAVSNNAAIDLIGDNGGTLTVRAAGADSGENIATIAGGQVDAQAAGEGVMNVYESWPTFTKGDAVSSSVSISENQEVAKFTVSAQAGEDVTFDATETIGITPTFIENDSTGDNNNDQTLGCDLYADDVLVDSPADVATAVEISFVFATDTVTIPAGDSVDFIVKCDTRELLAEGNFIQLSMTSANTLTFGLDGDGGAYNEAAIILKTDMVFDSVVKD